MPALADLFAAPVGAGTRRGDALAPALADLFAAPVGAGTRHGDAPLAPAVQGVDGGPLGYADAAGPEVIQEKPTKTKTTNSATDYARRSSNRRGSAVAARYPMG